MYTLIECLNNIYTFLKFELKKKIHLSWNSMVWYVCIPT